MMSWISPKSTSARARLRGNRQDGGLDEHRMEAGEHLRR
jgi:hypothetical protein